MKRVYATGKIFRFPDKLRDLRAGTVSAPIHVRLKPTNRCTHRCGYCCYRNPELFLSERLHEQDEIPRAKLFEIAHDLGGMGVRAVTFSGGGEPLCHPHLLEAAEVLAGGGVKVAMLTNGGLLAGAAAVWFARRAVWVRVSMDAADRDLYAKMRCCPPEEFDRVCANIRSFARMEGRTCALGLNLIVTRENAGDVLRFLELAKEMGAGHVKVSGAVVSADPGANAAYLSPLLAGVKRQLAGAAALADGRFAVIDKFHLPDSEEEAYERSYTTCPFAQCLTVIAADQNVYACQDKAYTTGGLLGSIRERPFRDLWFSGEFRQRLAALNPGLACRHHCVAHAKNLMLLDYLEADQDHLDFV